MPNAMLQSLLTTSKYIINSENGNSGLQTREILVFVIFLILFGLNIHILSVGILSDGLIFLEEIQFLRTLSALHHLQQEETDQVGPSSG